MLGNRLSKEKQPWSLNGDWSVWVSQTAETDGGHKVDKLVWSKQPASLTFIFNEVNTSSPLGISGTSVRSRHQATTNLTQIMVKKASQS